MNKNRFNLGIVLIMAIQVMNTEMTLSPMPFHMHENKSSFCEAHRICFIEGESRGKIGYMAGERFLELVNQVNFSESLWININALLCEPRRRHKCHWIFGENQPPHFRLPKDVFGEMPFSLLARVSVYTNSKKIEKTDTEAKQHAFICDYRPMNRSGNITRLELFHSKSNLLRRMQALPDRTAGCFHYEHNVSLTWCAFRCHRDHACRSFYYNRISLACIHTKYVDSAMANRDRIRNKSHWIRFSRPKWSSAGEL
ncbi:hypothetical protein D915_005997 [Fasciola hepatica]|uniref:Apple domain-containing protein n=1 Tax=Fasciola hepatica TaxID=6192 RepID=A0A4E0RAI4_FASHE|nr:hypothetical protein D915_005997 [Fasciola hepatica]